MKNSTLNLPLTIICTISIFSGCQCDKEIDPPCSTTTERQKSFINVITTINKPQYSVGDTIFISLSFPDSLVDINGKNKAADFGFFSLIAETYRLQTPLNSTFPNLQPVFPDFTPILIDGQIINLNAGNFSAFRCRRQPNLNTLSAGLICMSKGRYLLRFGFGQNGAGAYINALNRIDDPCTSFFVSPLLIGTNNSSIFSSYNVSYLPIVPGLIGYAGVTISDLNYSIIDVN